ncbi:MAG: response regulator transcription factor [Gammaproteobacteria bacterium]|jgi:DNA-binding response OmpR family regulator
MRLLVVEDDPSLGPALKKELEHQGFAVDLADNGVDGEILGRTESYDAAVLDLGLPQRPGLEVLQNWRHDNINIPVVILTARDAWHERVDGFKAGADDYVGKPFHNEELVARINALLKRTHRQTTGTLREGNITLDEETQRATDAQGNEHGLTGTEFRLLRYFMHHPGKILSKTVLTEHVYDYDSDKDSNVIEVYVKRLRKLLGQDIIETRRGQGYIFHGSRQ